MAFTYPISGYPNGAKWTGTYNNASQCMGFAYLVFDKTYGIVNGDSIPKSTFSTEAAVKEVFNTINDGAMVNFTWKPGTSYAGGNHSVIVTSITSSGISVYDCNYSAKDTIGSRTWTWKNLIDKFDTITGGLNP